MREGTHYVYRVVDVETNGTLYVGVTCNPVLREQAHQRKFGDQIEFVIMSTHPDRASGLEAETKLIQALQPPENIRHSRVGELEFEVKALGDQFRAAVDAAHAEASTRLRQAHAEEWQSYYDQALDERGCVRYSPDAPYWLTPGFVAGSGVSIERLKEIYEGAGWYREPAA